MNHDEIFEWIEKAPVHKIPRAYGLHKLIRYFSTRKSATIDDFSKYYFQTDFNELRYWDLYELCLLIDQRLLRSNQSRIHNQVNRDSKKHELIDKLKNLQVGNGIEDSVAFNKKLLERYGQHILELDRSTTPIQVRVSPCEEAELIENDFEALVRESSNLTDEARQKRLLLARKAPESYQAQVTLFRRNPDVVAEALKLAKGVCQKCKKEAPFIRLTDKKPYLEIHHKKRLSDGGDDTVENAIALCPNCHRKNHYGVDDDTQPGS